MNGFKESRWFESLSCIFYTRYLSENHTYPLASVNVTDEVVATVVDVGRVDPLECCGLLSVTAVCAPTHFAVDVVEVSHGSGVEVPCFTTVRQHRPDDGHVLPIRILRTVSVFLSTPEYVSMPCHVMYLHPVLLPVLVSLCLFHLRIHILTKL